MGGVVLWDSFGGHGEVLAHIVYGFNLLGLLLMGHLGGPVVSEGG